MANIAAPLIDLANSILHGAPRAPPPLPQAPLPYLPPQVPPVDPPLPPLIVCPPSLPPPAAPPGFHVWAAQIPGWFWWMFVFMFLIACMGTVAIVYILRELRRQRLGIRVPGSETQVALEDLRGRVRGGRV